MSKMWNKVWNLKMKTRIVHFFKENRLGAIVGAVVSCFSFVVFFASLAYGASCPEAGPETCYIDLEPIRPFLIFNAVGLMSIWAIIFFSSQQIMLFFGIVTPDSYSSSFFAINIMPAISFALTVFVFAVVGGSIQRAYQGIRK